MVSISHPNESRKNPSPPTPCPLCDGDHDEVLALLAEAPADHLRRIPSADLESEWEYLKREMASAKADTGYSAGLATLNRHRLNAIDAEIDRRRQLERYGGPRGKSGRIPLGVVTEIKERIDLAALVAEDLGEAAWYRWGKVKFSCRLHGDGVDRDPSLQVYEEDHRWYCFGCNDGGDAFAWLLKARGMEWREAVAYLAKRLNIKFEVKA